MKNLGCQRKEKTDPRQLSLVPRIPVVLLAMISIILLGSPRSVLALPTTIQNPPLAIEPPSPPAVPVNEDQARVMIELDALPVAAIYARANSQTIGAASLAALTQTHLRTVENAQAQLAAQLTASGAQELFRVQRVYNGIAVQTNTSQLEIITALPGVKAVHPLIPKRPTNARSVPYTGAPSLWAGTDLDGIKLTGQGIRVAVIDTGLDYLHTDFGGPGSGYAENDPTVIGDAPNFPGPKVNGGFDFAGDNYDANLSPGNQPFPQPDPDPMDCYTPGHGTHVAGTVAGYGVDRDGAQYKGPYDSPLDFTQFKIGPGVAPGAEIYALKVFGCQGSTELTDLAIEWAVDPNGDGDFADHVDVINMSLGSPFGSIYDTTAIASENAAKIGVVVVASAGNSGDTYFATGSPAVGNRVISVASVGLPDPTPGAEATIASYSARGPRTPDSALKPDIAAPGQSIDSARAGSGDRGRRLSGTSMAAPHVAGAAALLRQAHPDWSVEEIKALLMNSANFPAGKSTGVTPATFGPTRTGSGVLDLRRAISTTVLAYEVGAPGGVSLSFGAPEVLDTTTLTRTLRLVNKGMTTTVVSLAYEPVNDLPGADIDGAIPTPITIAVGGHVEVVVRMRAVATDLKHARDPAASEAQLLPRHWLAEETGFLIIRPSMVTTESNASGSSWQVSVPLHAAPRPAANLRADGPLEIDVDLQGKLTLTGVGIDSTIGGENPPVGIISMVSAFELAYSRPEPSAQRAIDVVDPLAYGDLRHVGVTSDYPQNNALDEAMLYFGIVTDDNWSSPNRLQVNILVDANGDGLEDFRLFNSNEAGYSVGNQFNDAFVTVVQNLSTLTYSRRQFLNVKSALAFDTAIYNTNVMILPVRAADIGLTEETGQFRYRVATAVSEEAGIRDQTPTLVFDARKPGLDLFSDNPTAPMIEAEDGTVIEARLDTLNFFVNDSKGLLVLHHHNRTGAHAEAIPLRYNFPEHLYLPLVIME